MDIKSFFSFPKILILVGLLFIVVAIVLAVIVIVKDKKSKINKKIKLDDDKTIEDALEDDLTIEEGIEKIKKFTLDKNETKKTEELSIPEVIKIEDEGFNITDLNNDSEEQQNYVELDEEKLNKKKDEIETL